MQPLTKALGDGPALGRGYPRSSSVRHWKEQVGNADCPGVIRLEVCAGDKDLWLHCVPMPEWVDNQNCSQEESSHLFSPAHIPFSKLAAKLQ